MTKRLSAVLVFALFSSLVLMRAQQFPWWERLLQHYGGNNDQTPVSSMKMGNHMQMSLKGASQPGDEQRAKQIVFTAREVVARYEDVNRALQEGYKPFHPTGKMGEEVHYTNYRYARVEPEGMKAIGVMYAAPQNSTPEELNAIAPLSIATWHRHVDFCGGPRNLPLDEQFGRHAQFGPQGNIHTEEACDQAHGLWIPVVFGWMTHVYPTAKSSDEIWAGMDMHMEANTDSEETIR